MMGVIVYQRNFGRIQEHVEPAQAALERGYAKSEFALADAIEPCNSQGCGGILDVHPNRHAQLQVLQRETCRRMKIEMNSALAHLNIVGIKISFVLHRIGVALHAVLYARGNRHPFLHQQYSTLLDK